MKHKSDKTNLLDGLDPKRAGIDIGAKSVFVCICDMKGRQHVREYPTYTKTLIHMAKWLKENKVKSVAMESTGVYWIPVYEILENRGFEVLLVNAHHLKNVPGRKTDVKDAQWIQQLHSSRLLNGSFRPSDEVVGLRAYVRHRRRLYEHASTHVQHMQKSLTQMNVQLSLVVVDITGKTGRLIIRAILEGERDPARLASLRDPHCKKSEEEIALALEGNWRDEHLFTLKQAYEGWQFYQEQIVDCEKKIEVSLRELDPSINEDREDNNHQLPPSHGPVIKKSSSKRSAYHFDAGSYLRHICGVDLTAVPGIDASTALTFIAEVGLDMSKWKGPKQFASWLGLSPGSKISGGKVLSSKTRPTNNRAAAALRMAALSLCRSQSALGAFLRRMKARLGAPKAITAVAHKLALILYRMLKNCVEYEDSGADYYEQRYKDRRLKRLRREAAQFGCTLTPNA